MTRIAGITLPNKRIEIALTYVYGIGRSRAKQILEKLQIKGDIRANDLTPTEQNRLRDEIEKNCRVEGELRRDIQANIKRLKEIGCYRGSRHAKGLPVRGQRTKTNSRTVRGNTRRTMGSGRSKLTKT
jgi:small subunit ribosomal protein S13